MTTWRTSTHSAGSACVQAAEWRKSTHSSVTQCVEVAAIERPGA